MSTNNFENIMNKLAAGLQREAIESLQETKECFDQEGRRFDDEFKKNFFQFSNNR